MFYKASTQVRVDRTTKVVSATATSREKALGHLELNVLEVLRVHSANFENTCRPWPPKIETVPG